MTKHHLKIALNAIALLAGIALIAIGCVMAVQGEEWTSVAFALGMGTFSVFMAFTPLNKGN